MIHINTLNQITQSWINPAAYVFISRIEDARCKSKHLNKRKSVWMFYEKTTTTVKWSWSISRDLSMSSRWENQMHLAADVDIFSTCYCGISDVNISLRPSLSIKHNWNAKDNDSLKHPKCCIMPLTQKISCLARDFRPSNTHTVQLLKSGFRHWGRNWMVSMLWNEKQIIRKQMNR